MGQGFRISMLDISGPYREVSDHALRLLTEHSTGSNLQNEKKYDSFSNSFVPSIDFTIFSVDPYEVHCRRSR